MSDGELVMVGFFFECGEVHYMQSANVYFPFIISLCPEYFDSECSFENLFLHFSYDFLFGMTETNLNFRIVYLIYVFGGWNVLNSKLKCRGMVRFPY